jgi:hypothetical protein
MMLIFLLTATNLGVYLPSPHDSEGWGLRVHNLSGRGPYLVGEDVGRIRFDVTLINFAKETREHDPLPVSRDIRDLNLSIIHPDGSRLLRTSRSGRRDPFTQPLRLRAGESNSATFDFFESGFVFYHFGQAGRHRLEASIKVGGKTIAAPPVEFEVVAIPPGAVLVSHAVRLEGHALTRPAQERLRPAVQQVKVGDRTLLVYRGHYDPAKPNEKTYFTERLAELPGKVDMTVEGAYGNWKPLAITYKTSPDAKATKLVIHSVDGMPWTEEDERRLQERLSRVAPMPRPAARP